MAQTNQSINLQRLEDEWERQKNTHYPSETRETLQKRIWEMQKIHKEEMKFFKPAFRDLARSNEAKDTQIKELKIALNSKQKLIEELQGNKPSIEPQLD